MPRSTTSPIASCRSGPGPSVRDPRGCLAASRPGPPGTRSTRRARRLGGLLPRASISGSRSSRRVAGGAIKLSPASDFAQHFAGPNVEIELISLRGECKEATVWFGELASCRRRATRLPEDVTWTDRDGPTERPAAGRPALDRGSTIPTRRCSAPACSTDSPCEHGLESGRRRGRLPDRGAPGRRPRSSTAFEVREVSSLDLKASEAADREAPRSARWRSRCEALDVTPGGAAARS